MFPSLGYPEINKSPQSNGQTYNAENGKCTEEGLVDLTTSELEEDDTVCLIDSDYDGDTDDEDSEVLQGVVVDPKCGSSLPNLASTSPTSTGKSCVLLKGKRKMRRKRRSEGDAYSRGAMTIFQQNKRTLEDLASKRNSIHETIFVEQSTSTSSPSSPSSTDVPPLRAHFDYCNSIGRRRGIGGSSAEASGIDKSYLDVALFTMFYFTDRFDEWLLNESLATGFPTSVSKEIRGLLRKEIVYSLRTSYFCPSSFVSKLFGVIFPTSQPTTIDFSTFFQYFCEKLLTVPEVLHYSNLTSRLVNYIQVPSKGERKRKGSKKHSCTSVQELFESSMDDLKLLSMPNPALFLALNRAPSRSRAVPIIPNVQLDLTEILMQLSDDSSDAECEGDEGARLVKLVNHSVGTLIEQRLRQGKKIEGLNKGSNNRAATTPLCQWFSSLCSWIYGYLQNFTSHFATTALFGVDSLSVSNSIEDYNWSASSYLLTYEDIVRENAARKNSLINTTSEDTTLNTRKGKKVWLDLLAVVCLDANRSTYHDKYTVYCRCGENPRRRAWAQWVHFDPFDQGAPLVRKVDDVGKWLRRLERHPEKVKSAWNSIPSDIQLMLKTAKFYIYTPHPEYESQNTLFSYSIETC